MIDKQKRKQVSWNERERQTRRLSKYVGRQIHVARKMEKMKQGNRVKGQTDTEKYLLRRVNEAAQCPVAREQF